MLEYAEWVQQSNKSKLFGLLLQAKLHSNYAGTE